MTRLRTHNNRAKVKALSRRQINERKATEIRRRFRRHFQALRKFGAVVTSSFRTLGDQMALAGKSFRSFHLQTRQSDLHSITAHEFGIDRKAAKDLNYFAMYGGGPDGKPFSNLMRKYQK